MQQEARGREHGAELCDSHLSLLLLPPWHRPPSVSETRSPWARATAKSNQLNKTYLIAFTPRCSGGEAPLLGRLLCSVRGEKAQPIVHPYHVAAAVLFRNPTPSEENTYRALPSTTSARRLRLSPFPLNLPIAQNLPLFN